MTYSNENSTVTLNEQPLKRDKRKRNHRAWQVIPRLIQRDGKACAYCGCKLGKIFDIAHARAGDKNCTAVSAPDNATVDHVLSLMAGGTNERKNLVAACRECNEEKDNYHPAAYVRYHIRKLIRQVDHAITTREVHRG